MTRLSEEQYGRLTQMQQEEHLLHTMFEANKLYEEIYWSTGPRLGEIRAEFGKTIDYLSLIIQSRKKA